MASQRTADSIILEEEMDPNYTPTDVEISECERFIRPISMTACLPA